MLGTIIGVIVWLLFSFGLGYLWHPAISLASSEFVWYLVVIFFVYGIITLIVNSVSYFENVKKIHYVPWILLAVLVPFVIIVSLVGAPVFNPNPYRDAVTIEEASFTEDFADITSQDYSLLDLDTAQRLGDRVLGKVPNASWYNVSNEYNLITYKGEQYRISPLEYRDLFAYFKANSVGIPGYVLVKVDTMEAEFIKTEQPIKVSTSGCFSQNLSRKLRTQYPTIVFDKSYMEIDDEGNPYWITVTLEPHAGMWGAPVANGYVITDAYTGESKAYSLNDAKPEWLDHVYGLKYLMDRVSWHYWYVHGWWNVSRTDVNFLTYNYRQKANDEKGEPAFYGYNTFIGNDDGVKIITGLTPANRTESNVGFLTVDCATGETRYYPIPGAEESSAQSVVEGIIQQMGYQSTFPVMVNIGGEPAYLMNLKDKSGLIQRYAIVNYKNYSKAIVGDTFEETLTGYLEMMGKVEVVKETPTEVFEKEGVITEKYQAEVEGTTMFYYVIDEELYKASITINEEQVMFKPGNTVKISYEDGTIKLITEITKK